MATKQASLAAQTPGALTKELKMPSIFSAPTEPVKARKIAPYITFAHPKRADEWAKIVGKFGNVDEGDTFLVEPNGITKLPTMKLAFIACKQYWAQANPAGELIAAAFEERPHPWKEHIQAVVLVYLEDRIVPANIEFRTTKCGAAKTMSDALADAASPDWAARSPQHKETLVCTQPFMRFYGECAHGPNRTSKTSGLPYRPMGAVVKPTSVTEWRLLAKLIEDPETEKAMEAAADRFQYRVDEVTKKLQK